MVEKKKTTKKVNARADKEYEDICSECNGEGYKVIHNHYLADNDYE